MKKPTMNAIRKQAQAGFTLIELIVVIVILGILAATALPRFANLGGDARVASLNAARGAISTTVATARGQWLMNPAIANVLHEGQQIDFAVAPAVVTGYPIANSGLLGAAGITNADYTIIQPGSAATANSPVTGATTIAIIPNSVAGTISGLTCFISYTASAAANTPPAISQTPTAANCQ